MTHPVERPILAGRFQVLARLDRGSVAEVYLADDLVLGRPVVVKTLLPMVEPGSPMHDRFHHEARMLAEIEHPHVIGLVCDAVDQDNLRFFVMEHAAHGSLRFLESPEAERDPLQIGTWSLQVCSALDTIHRLGIIHRDVKPGNVLIHADGSARLADFGISHDPRVQLTQAGDSLYSPLFSAPEQAADPREATARSDLYSLGATLFWALTRRSPLALLAGETRGESLEAVPAPLRDAVAHSTAFRPENRFVDALEMHASLEIGLADMRRAEA